MTPSVPAAGVDPASIPGITSPGPDEAEGATAGAAGAEGSPRRSSEPLDEVVDAEPDAAAVEAEESQESEEDDDTGGPTFEVHDHRGSILAGRSGVTLRLDGEEARFDWDEIGAVQIDLPRFGRRFSVTVHTVARRWYDADVLAPSRNALGEWEARLDAVLDAYFEDSSATDGAEGESGEADEGAERGADTGS
nr:hypothetical protein [Streptomyces taklimakanensis]